MRREELIARPRELAARLDMESVPRATFTRETGISEWQVLKHFDSWNGLVAAAGLEPIDTFKRIDDDELMEAMRDAFVEAGGIVPAARFRKLCRYSDSSYKRFGGFGKALVHFREWARIFDPEFPYLDDLPSPRSASPAKPTAVRAPAPADWPKGEGDRGGNRSGNWRPWPALRG